jgi:hypothetical protein
MATSNLDPREALAKMRAEEEAAAAALAKMQADNEGVRKKMLEELREADLQDVKEKCKLHNFSASDLRGALKAKGAKRTVARKSTPRKSTPRKAAVKNRVAKAN